MQPRRRVFHGISRGFIACAAALLTLFFASILAARASEVVLHDFSSATDGINPLSGVVHDAYGNLYGTTSAGAEGSGVLFKLTPTKAFSVVCAFTSASGIYGSPRGGVAFGPDGLLYGTTYSSYTGYGSVYRVATDGSAPAVLHTFDGADGEFPSNGVAFDSSGNLFGVTLFGGKSNKGVLYEIDAAGVFSVLHYFEGGTTDGLHPNGVPLIGSDGSIYGTAQFGGAAKNGIIYRVTPNGLFSVLYSFHGFASSGRKNDDGAQPATGLSFDPSGNLIGVAVTGGVYGFGTVFRLTAAGSFEVLHAFAGATDGSRPESPVTAEASGAIFGTTPIGGQYNGGQVYEITPTNQFLSVFSFGQQLTGAAVTGYHPFGPLLIGKNGNLIGTTVSGGNANGGVVYKIVAP